MNISTGKYPIISFIFLVTFAVGLNKTVAQGQLRPIPRELVAERTRIQLEREIDRKQMLKIYSALKKYEEEKGALPNWLSDLVPDYIDDPSTFVSPYEIRTGVSRLHGSYDPVYQVSYIYEFNGNPAATRVELRKERKLLMKDWKKLQVAEFGPVVPILRCHLHRPVLNISYNGHYYETGTIWETDPMTVELMARFGIPEPGDEIKKAKVTVLSDLDGSPLKGISLVITDRVSELSQLPPLFLSTDELGKANVPLGYGYTIHYKISVQSDSWASLPVEWNLGETPEPPTDIVLRLRPTVSVGGKFTYHNAKPIANALVVVNGLMRDDAGQISEHQFDVCVTNQNGEWSADSVPQGLQEMSVKMIDSNGVELYYIVGIRPTSGSHINIKELYSSEANVIIN